LDQPDIIEEEEDEMSIASQHPKLKFLKDYDVNSKNYTKASEAGKHSSKKRLILYLLFIQINISVW
jgi:hypothetical protein